MAYQLTNEEDEKLYEMWQNGWCDAQIADMSGYSVYFIRNWRRNRRLKGHYKARYINKLTQRDQYRYSLWEKDMSDAEIAAYCNVSVRAVEAWRNRHGLRKNFPDGKVPVHSRYYTQLLKEGKVKK